MFDADIFRPTDVWLAAQSHATGCVATRKICVVYVSSKLIKRGVTGVEMGPGVDAECTYLFWAVVEDHCSWTMEQEEEDNESLT